MNASARKRFLLIAAFEGSLLIGAALLSRMTQTPLLEGFKSNPAGWGLALALAVLCFFAFQVTYRSPYAPFRKIRFFLDERARPLFFGLGPYNLAVVAGLAGFGEEALFRGWLQTWLGSFTSAWIACLAAGVIFGAAHSITIGYAVCTTLIGIALGALQIHSGGWLAPAFAHALYDFLALHWYLHRNH